MAPAPKPSAKPNRRVLIAVGVLALLVVGYILLRPKGTGATPANSPTGTDAGVPQTGGGAASDSGAQASADLLAAIAGENQQLLRAFLSSSSGLVSLAGSSLGSTAGFGASSVGEPTSVGGGGFASTTSTPAEQTSSLALPPAQTLQASQSPGFVAVTSSTSEAPAAAYIAGGFTPEEAAIAAGDAPHSVTSDVTVMEPASSQQQAASPYVPATVPVYNAPEAQLETQHGQGGQPQRYYTYKNQVPLTSGQTLHFTAGKGFYGA